MSRYIKDGLVGVLVSPGYGIGFSTLGDKEMCMDSDLIEAHLENDSVEFRHILINKYDNPYVDENVVLEWVTNDTKFIIAEDNGYEKLIIIDEENIIIA
tara:strand:- start:312 stop:608 length:297 start_codon:yes stop_codon:yes gene_type:complete